MPNFLIIRLHPAAPTDAVSFAKALDSLVVSAFDMSYHDPRDGTALGSATYHAPTVTLHPRPIPPTVDYPAGTGIVQHFDLVDPGGIAPLNIAFRPAATAVIEIPGGLPEYETVDLRVVLTRTAGTIDDHVAYYNVPVVSSAALPLDQYPGQPPSVYIPLPGQPDPNAVQLAVPTDGSPPAFDDLIIAVTKVLNSDPGAGQYDLANLTPDQCRNIAYEIAWSPLHPLPGVPKPSGVNTNTPLEDIYDSADNDGSFTNVYEQTRQQFEGSLNSYYSKNNAIALRLTRFVFSLSAAVACERRSRHATAALLSFPVDPSTASMQAEVLLTGLDTAVPPVQFGVPAAYFYALGANVPPQITADQRFKMACGDTTERVLTELRTAVSDAVITAAEKFTDGSAGINPAQAARRLAALNGSLGVPAPQYKMRNAMQGLVNDWLAFPAAANWEDYISDSQPQNFWGTELATQPGAYLDLVLCALTQGFVTPPTPPGTLLGDRIVLWLPSTQAGNPPPSVAVLRQVTDAQWTSFFQPHPDWLPPFTRPGTTSAQIAAFIRYVKKFFAVAPEALPTTFATGPESLPTLDEPSKDWLGQCITTYQNPPLSGGPVVFGNGFDKTLMHQAAQVVFPGDPEAQAWAVDALAAIDGLTALTKAAVIQPPQVDSPGLRFALLEALYARGFRGPDDLNGLSAEDFQKALTGTVAYPYAADIWNAVHPTGPPVTPCGDFHPVNPDGCLTNCIPPPCLSPLGPIAYLNELLQLTAQSTCAKPSGDGTENSSLAYALSQRRGPLGDLLASCANLETPLPKIDLVNECLEFMASTVPVTTAGTVYQTASDQVAGHRLCKESNGHDCHEPAELFATLPEHSSPANPVEPAGQQAYQHLKHDFSACCLPYSQPLDVARSYLHHLRTSRYEVMRTFRKDITEFVLDPSLPPPTFQAHLWRYPVRHPFACEYLCITPEECFTLYSHDFSPEPGEGDVPLWQVYGFTSKHDGKASWETIVVNLKEFLARICLTYCEFIELQRAKFVTFILVMHEGERRVPVPIPDCEPCCLERYTIEFQDPEDPFQALKRLAVFVRLWRTLRHGCRSKYSFQELADICNVLQLFRPDGKINPDFIRQMAAFQMLRDDLGLPLTPAEDKPAGPSPADRIPLLALWSAGSAPAAVNRVIHRLLEHIARRAEHQHGCRPRAPEFVKLLLANLDPLSRLAGFDPDTPAKTWSALPTHTLRFAEVLVKICASNWSIGEILYLFTTEPHLDGDDPFAFEEANEALDLPLDLPDDAGEHTLWALRRKLLAIEVSEQETHTWSWDRIEASLRDEFGYEPGAIDYLRSLGTHFFPGVLESCGHRVDLKERQYRVPLAGSQATLWNVPPDGPFHYDPKGELWTQLPLRDEAVISKLSHSRPLTAGESQAVQDLYFLPRIDLAPFAFLFPSFADADQHLIQEPDEARRWFYFRRHFALARIRCFAIAEHLAAHVGHATRLGKTDGTALAWRVLRRLFADENRPTAGGEAWEDDSGQVPAVEWTPRPAGGAFAALLGLTGTGLLGDFQLGDHTEVWREVRGPLDAFGHELNRAMSPVPTVLPALDFSLPPQHLRFAVLRKGFAIKDQDGELLGGAQGFRVRWSGVLLVEEEGVYTFRAGAPTPGHEEPNFEAAEQRRWRVTLQRGQKMWILLHHRWTEEQVRVYPELSLRRGAYHITVEFHQPQPDFARAEETVRKHTGFVLKYSGPDTGQRFTAIPLSHLFRAKKDAALNAGIPRLDEHQAGTFLRLLYTSSLRDIRRTYQRAFKALLFAERFALSARTISDDGQSEVDYLLAHPERFMGVAYYVPSGQSAYTRHQVYFDFNLLPLGDNYRAPRPQDDRRAAPTAKRMTALFDWWERLFDYTRMRAEARSPRAHAAWLLFHDAAAAQPADCTPLLRHLGIDFRHAPLVLHYLDAHAPSVYTIDYTDLEDDRWAVRVWHAERWVRRLLHAFCAKNITAARPALWAANDPSVAVPGTDDAGQPYPPGNVNLTAFVDDGSFEHGAPRRYEAVKRLNDGLRERARAALVAYLCSLDRVPVVGPGTGFAKTARDLSDRLLIDVATGIHERVSRIEDGISACQSFVRRARLGLEVGWPVTPGFARLWDRCFATLAVWQAATRRKLYKENYIDWDELEQARRIEAFRFLEAELRRTTLTIAAPGGLEWWPDQLPPGHPALLLLEKRDPSKLQRLNASSPSYEGLDLLGTPERDARPSWLAALHADNSQPPPPPSPPPPSLTEALRSEAQVPAATAGCTTPPELPFWIQAAIRLGVHFVRVAAAGVQAAKDSLAPYRRCHEPECCCTECGKVHPAHMDEYYFWLVFARRNVEPEMPNNETQRQGGAATGTPLNEEFGFQDAIYDVTVQDASAWHDVTQLPQLLRWEPGAAVRLAWCRVHNGEFQQPRCSDDALAVDVTTPPELTFQGRTADSLYFSVSNATSPPGYLDPSLPGFRYDLADDDAVVLPLVGKPAPAPTFTNGLPAYPYFVYHAPGAPLFPRSLYGTALAVAWSLRAHCRFEAALRWYELVFNPLQRDCAWVRCSSNTSREVSGNGESHRSDAVREGRQPQPACCDSANAPDAKARDRSILLHYLETHLQSGDALLHRYCREAFEAARLHFDTLALILGAEPVAVPVVEPANPVKVSAFQAYFAPLNPRLLELYERVADRRAMIQACLDGRRLRFGPREREMPYFCGDGQCDADHTGEICAQEEEWCHRGSPYRFMMRIQKAKELAGRVSQLGASLLSAFEKGDAEYLASLRARFDSELQALLIPIRQDQWREADWQIQSLQRTKQVTQTNLLYYQNTLINQGIPPLSINQDEAQYENLTNTSIVTRATGNTIQAIGEAMKLIPDLFVGFPCEETWIPLGTKLAGVFESTGKIIDIVADVESATAGLNLTEASWERRLEEWQHQVQVLTIDVEQIELQILAAERRRDQALHELNNLQRQREQAAETLDFLRDKFTAHDLYLYLQKETAALHAGMYELALSAARQAEAAFNFERGHTHRRFLPEHGWDRLQEGLLAGEKLEFALQRMEKAYLDENVREYELTKHFSLRLHFPEAYLRLRTQGVCHIDIPEWMYDLDFPGFYMRRIKNVSITVPCVAGPFTGVHCRLTLLSSATRIDPRLTPPPHHCCCNGKHHAYDACADDPRLVRCHGAREAIATSSGQNDTGMFELNFRDDRYLPFEFQGAVSRWRIELPPENNAFDPETISDLILHVNYTAREGGELLRRAAREAAERRLPGDGWAFFDVRHEFPDAWELFVSRRHGHAHRRELRLRLGRELFPYVPGHRALQIDGLVLVFEASHAEPRDCHILEFMHGHEVESFREEEREGEIETIRCTLSDEWPRLYHGVHRGRLESGGHHAHHNSLAFRFPAGIEEVTRLFLFCRFEATEHERR